MRQDLGTRARTDCFHKKREGSSRTVRRIVRCTATVHCAWMWEEGGWSSRQRAYGMLPISQSPFPGFWISGFWVLAVLSIIIWGIEWTRRTCNLWPNLVPLLPPNSCVMSKTNLQPAKTPSCFGGVIEVLLWCPARFPACWHHPIPNNQSIGNWTWHGCHCGWQDGCWLRSRFCQTHQSVSTRRLQNRQKTAPSFEVYLPILQHKHPHNIAKNHTAHKRVRLSSHPSTCLQVFSKRTCSPFHHACMTKDTLRTNCNIRSACLRDGSGGHLSFLLFLSLFLTVSLFTSACRSLVAVVLSSSVFDKQ